jgi:hypothetical protein
LVSIERKTASGSLVSLEGRHNRKREGPAMFNLVTQNSTVVLYILQAATYGAAAASSHGGNYKSLTVCYLASAVLHGLLGACHLMHVERLR